MNPISGGMPAAVASVPAAAAAVALAPALGPARYEWLRPIDEHPRLVAFAQTGLGKVALLVVFTFLMKWSRVPGWELAAVFLAAMSFFPALRRPLLTIAAVAWIFVIPPIADDTKSSSFIIDVAYRRGAGFVQQYLLTGSRVPLMAAMLGGVAAVWLFGYAYTWLVRRYANSPIGRRPITGLIVIVCGLLAAESLLTGWTWVWFTLFTVILGHYMWFIAYTATEPKNRDGTHPAPQPGFWRPFWGAGFRVPIGKGAAYLDRVEAKDAETLAVVQLKAVQLLAWATVLSVVRIVFANVLFGPNHGYATNVRIDAFPGFCPTYAMALDAQMAGNPVAWHLRWLALIAMFITNLLHMAICGHKAIAILRMAGFNAFRMFYRPLEATTIAEFFNRVHYYLKEMLAIFFFYPTYLRYFKQSPRLRVMFATLASAGLGNFIYHFLYYDRFILRDGFLQSLWTYHIYAVYALILGLAIGFSQIRILANKKKPAPTGWRKARAVAGVLFFYCLLTVFEENRRDVNVLDFAMYLVNLFRV